MSTKPHDGDSPGLEPVTERDIRAAAEYLLVDSVPDTPECYHVYSEDGTQYFVDERLGMCTCHDAQYRNPEGGCKHRRRVGFETGDREVPACISRESMDPLLVRALDELEADR